MNPPGKFQLSLDLQNLFKRRTILRNCAFSTVVKIPFGLNAETFSINQSVIALGLRSNHSVLACSYLV
jgi:hypothetical protein